MKKLLTLLCSWGTLATAFAGPLDANGDGNDDLYLQNSAGQIYSWHLRFGKLDSATFVHSGTLADWQLVARADLNQDGTGDLIFQNSTGQIFAWLMNSAGFAFSSLSIYSGDALADWRVSAAADLNSDGIADLILQNTSGQIIGWIMNGAGGPLFAVTIYSGPLGTWRLRAAGDVNRDFTPDLILQNSQNGHVVALLMNGLAGIKENVTIYGSDLIGWRLRTAVDLNLDRVPDLIFQNDNGQVFGLLIGGETSTPIGSVNVWDDVLLDWEVR